MVQDDGQLQARLARAMRETRRSRGLETALAVGGAVLDGWFGGDLERWRSGVGDRTLRALARDARIAVSASTLYRFVAITALCRRMGRTSTTWARATSGRCCHFRRRSRSRS